MKTIIQLDSIFHLFGLFVRLTEDGAEHVVMPTAATIFPNKKEAQVWLKNNLSHASDYSILSGKKLDTLLKEFQEYLDEGMPLNEIVLIDHSRNYEFDEKVHTMFDVMDWLYWFSSQEEEAEVDQNVYSSWVHAQYKFDTIFSEFTKFYDRVDRESYIGLEIKCSREKSFESFSEELNGILDRYELTYRHKCKKYEGVAISISTRDNYESGVIYLVVIDREKDLWSVVRKVWGSVVEETGPCSLEKCFDFMIKRGYTYDH